MYRKLKFAKAALLLSVPVVTNTAIAGYTFESGDLSGEFNLDAAAVYVDTRHVNLGAGRVDGRNGENDGTKISWEEFFVKPAVSLKYKINPDFDLLAGGSIIGASTLGDGDAAGATRSSDSRTSTEEMYAGFRFGDIKFTAGRQNYMIGNGFIVMDGNLDLYGDAAFWLAPRTAFRDSAILAWGHDALHAQFFTLRTDDHAGDYRMTGGNIDYDLGGQATLGGGAFKVDSLVSNAEVHAARDGMQVYNLRALNAKIPGAPALTINTEYAVQRGSGSGVDYDASAWYLQGDYAFDQVPYKPVLGYRYTSYSGDDDLADNQQKSWDALSKGFTDWGTWTIGEVVGTYMLFGSNQKVQQFSVKSQLTDTLSMRLMHYQFWLDKKNFQGVPVSDTRFADETAIILDWTPTPSIHAAALYNWVKPKTAAKEVFGDDEKFNALEFVVWYHY